MLAAQVQAYAHAFALGGKKGFKQALQNLWRQALASVLHRKLHPGQPLAAFWAARSNSTLHRSGRGGAPWSIDSPAFFIKLISTCSIKMASAITGGMRLATIAGEGARCAGAFRMLASSKASATMSSTWASMRLGSLRFTKERMR